jgi:hypothetical protein
MLMRGLIHGTVQREEAKRYRCAEHWITVDPFKRSARSRVVTEVATVTEILNAGVSMPAHRKDLTFVQLFPASVPHIGNNIRAPRPNSLRPYSNKTATKGQR